MKLQTLKEQFDDLPELLRQQILLRLGAAAVALILFAVILFCTIDYRLCLPFLILAVYLTVSCSMLLCNCIKGRYLCLVGSCIGIQTEGVKKRIITIHANISGVALMIHVRLRIKDVSVGDTIVLYVSDHTPVYESNGVQVVHSYYAIGVKKEV